MELGKCDFTVAERTEMSYIPPLFRLPRAVIVSVLEFLSMVDLGRMDIAVTMKKKDVRQQFLLGLSEMRSISIRSVSVYAELVNDEREVLYGKRFKGKYTNSYLQLARLHWLSVRQLYVEELHVVCHVLPYGDNSRRNNFLNNIVPVNLCEFLQVTNLPSLQHLRLVGKFTKDELLHLVRRSHALQSINFKQCGNQQPNISVEECRFVAEFCPMLERLEISDGQISGEGLLKILHRCPYVKTMSSKNTPISHVDRLGAYAHVFDALELENSTFLGASLSTFLGGCTSLRTLSYDSIETFDQMVQDTIVLPDPRKCPRLEDLTFKYVTSANSFLPLMVLSSFKNLCVLEFLRCDLTVASAMPIKSIRQVDTLETLYMTNCHLNDEAFDVLIHGSINRLRCLIIEDNFHHTHLSSTAFKSLSTGSFHDTLEEVLVSGGHHLDISFTLNDLLQLASSCRHLTCLPPKWKDGLEESEVELFSADFSSVKFSDENRTKHYSIRNQAY